MGAGGRIKESAGKKITHHVTQDYKHDAGGKSVVKAGGGFHAKGEKKGTNINKPPKSTKLKVIKVEGPFDENDKKVSEIEKGVSYTFKASFNRPAAGAEIEHAKWAFSWDNGKTLINFNPIHGNGVAGKMIVTYKMYVPPYVDKENIRVYAYLERPADSASASCKMKQLKLPMLIGYSKGFDTKHHFLNKLNDEVKKSALSQEDSMYGLGGRITVTDCDNLDNLSVADLKNHMVSLIHTGTKSDNGLKAVGNEMVNHFCDSIGGEFENSVLNKVIDNDANFNSFVNAVAYKILIKLRLVSWNLFSIKENELVRFDNVAFNTDGNHDDGLTILIDAVEHIEVYIVEYQEFTMDKIYIKLKFVLYDTFGLDMEDIKKFGKRNSTSATRYVTSSDKNSHIYVQNNYGIGFSSWWILQHRFSCKPFITKVTIYRGGHYNKNIAYVSPKNKEKNLSNDKDYGQKD